MALGKHKIEYEVLEGWDQLPEGWSFVEVAGVACDSQDRVYVFNRGAYPMIVFDKEGKFLNAWGEGMFVEPARHLHRPPRQSLARRRQGPHGPQVHDRRQEADDARRVGQGRRHRLQDRREPGQARGGAVSPRHQRRRAAGRRHVHRRRLRQRPRPQVLQGRQAARSPGASRARTRASSSCRTASRSTARGWCMSPTARTRACRSSIPRASTCASGRSSTAPTTSSSTTRTCCTSPRAASTTT